MSMGTKTTRLHYTIKTVVEPQLDRVIAVIYNSRINVILHIVYRISRNNRIYNIVYISMSHTNLLGIFNVDISTRVLNILNVFIEKTIKTK